MQTEQALKKTFLVFLVAAATGTLGLFAVAARTPSSTEADASLQQAKTYIEDSEHQWVQAVTTGDTAVVERTLAPDFIGVGPDGKTFDKSVMVDLIRQAPQEYVTNRLNEMSVKFFGTTAIATGSETWDRRSELPKRGRFVWTDTWMLRNGQWQVVAGSDFVLPETD